MKASIEILAAMAPKAKASSKDKAVQIKKEPGTDDRKLVSNFLTTLKRGKTQEEKDVLNKYQKLSRYDSQKKELVGLWAGDKSCKWYSTWEKMITTAEAEKANERRGFGTR